MWQILLSGAVGIIGGIFNSLIGYLKDIIGEGTSAVMTFHQEGIAAARDLGLGVNQAQAYTRALIQNTIDLANKYGVTADAIKEIQRGISEATGRQLLLNEAETEGLLIMNKLVGSQTTNAFSSEIMNHLGGQVSTVQGAISKAYATAAKQGLNASKFSATVAKNLSMANKLSFKDGINGIIRMTALSERLGFNLQSIESAASKFMDFDSAIESSAQLNMLGGAAGAYGSNPLEMMYEANYNPEAFTERMTNMLKGLGTFDQKTGMGRVNGMNMDFARNIAKAMGISADEAVTIAKKQAEARFKESRFGNELTRRFGNDEEKRNYILNNSTYNTTTGRLELNGKDVSKLTESDLEGLMQFEGMSDHDIMKQQAQSLISLQEQLKASESAVSAAFAKGLQDHIPTLQKEVQSIGNYLKDKIEPIGKNVGDALGDILGYYQKFKPTLKWMADVVFGFFELITKYWEAALIIWAGFKLSKWYIGRRGGLGGFSKGGGIGKIFSGIWKGVSGLFRGTMNVLGATARGIGNIGKGLWNVMGKAASGLKTMLGGIWKGVMKGFSYAGRALKGMYRGLSSVITKVGRGLGTVVKGLYSGLKTSISALGRGLGNLLNKTGLPQYGSYVKGNYQMLRANGRGVWDAVRGSVAGPRVLQNGAIQNAATGKFMGNITSNAAKSNAAKYVLKGSKVATTGLASAGVGLLGAGVNMLGDHWADNGTINKGETAHQAMSALGTAAEYGALGATIGSLFPVIGTAVGATVGATVGGIYGTYDAWSKKEGNEDKGFTDWIMDKDAGIVSDIATMLIPGGQILLIVKHWEDITEAWDGLTEWFGETWDGVINWFRKTINWDTVLNIFSPLVGVFRNWGGIHNTVRTTLSGLRDRAVGVVQSVFAPFSGVIDGIRGRIDDFGNFINYIRTGFQRPIDTIQTVFRGIGERYDNIANTIGRFTQALSDPIGSIRSAIGLGGRNGNSGGSSGFWGTIKGVWNFAQASLFAEGGIVGGDSYTGDNIIARVNSGEMVLNKEQQGNLFNLINDYAASSAANRNVEHSTDGNVTHIYINNLDLGLDDAITEIVGKMYNNISNVMSIALNPFGKIIPKPFGENFFNKVPAEKLTVEKEGKMDVAVKDININLNGTIRLDGGSSSTSIDVRQLLNDTQFISSLKELIKQSINTDINGGRFMNDTGTMRGLMPSMSSIGRI